MEKKMILVLKELASSVSAVRAFQRDPESYLNGYPKLTQDERALLLEGDSGKVSAHVTGKVNAVTTIVVIILAPEAAGDQGDAMRQANHQDFWGHVAVRSDTLAA
jgi:hypothetical protein